MNIYFQHPSYGYPVGVQQPTGIDNPPADDLIEITVGEETRSGPARYSLSKILLRDYSSIFGDLENGTNHMAYPRVSRNTFEVCLNWLHDLPCPSDLATTTMFEAWLFSEDQNSFGCQNFIMDELARIFNGKENVLRPRDVSMVYDATNSTCILRTFVADVFVKVNHRRKSDRVQWAQVTSREPVKAEIMKRLLDAGEVGDKDFVFAEDYYA